MLDLIAYIILGKLTWILLILSFAILVIYENRHPKYIMSKVDVIHSYKTNIGVFVLNAIVLSIGSIVLTISNIQFWEGISSIASPWIRLVISFLILDGAWYYWHKTCHNFDWLWMFHRIHHNDPHMNVTTAFRTHIFELSITNVLKFILVVVAGIDAVSLVCVELITTIFIMFHHSNIVFKYEHILSKLFISPALHRTHHSVERDEHDSNYGAVLSIWDSMFGTRVETIPVNIGIKQHSPQTILKLVKFGFQQL